MYPGNIGALTSVRSAVRDLTLALEEYEIGMQSAEQVNDAARHVAVQAIRVAEEGDSQYSYPGME